MLSISILVIATVPSHFFMLVKKSFAYAFLNLKNINSEKVNNEKKKRGKSAKMKNKTK